MQIFEAADPVTAGQLCLSTHTRHPAEAVERGRPAPRSVLKRIDGAHAPLVERRLEPLPRHAGGAEDQKVVGGRPSEPAARGAKIFHAIGSGMIEGKLVRHKSRPRHAAAYTSGAEINLDAGDRATELPIVSGVTAIDRARGIDRADMIVYSHTDRDIIPPPAIAAVDAEVEAGPGLRCGRRHLGQGRQVRRRGRDCEQCQDEVPRISFRSIRSGPLASNFQSIRFKSGYDTVIPHLGFHIVYIAGCSGYFRYYCGFCDTFRNNDEKPVAKVTNRLSRRPAKRQIP